MQEIGSRGQYGGIVTRMIDLPAGTKFHVCNGYWEGRIVEKNDTKYMVIEGDGQLHDIADDFTLDIKLTNSKDIGPIGLKEFITVVYYDMDGIPSAFHVPNATTESLQAKFEQLPPVVIKNITIESTAIGEGTRFKTLFREQDIAAFLKHRNIKF